LGLGGTGAQQESLDHYSCVRANSHKFCVDQKGRWVCISVSTWSMVTILRLGHIQVKGEIVRIVTGIHREGR